MKRLSALLLTLLFVLMVSAPSLAIPVFARKYGFNCAMCHTAWPRLNDFGQKYRMNGYQIPGQEHKDKTIMDVPGAPIAMRTSAGYTVDKFSPDGSETETNHFEISGLDLFSGGLLGTDKGYFVAYLPKLSGNGVSPQDASLEQVNVVFANLSGNTWFNARIGKFEAAYVPFSQLRSVATSPYEVYAFNGTSGVSAPNTRGSLNTFALADTASALEVYGWGMNHGRYYLGISNGSGENRSHDSPSDFYVRGDYTFGRGLGQTSGQRVGATAYSGQARALDTGIRSNFNRLGFDASLNKSPYNLELQYIHGEDDGDFNVFAPGEKYKFSGGFAQLNRFEKESAIFLRYDWVNTPLEDNHDITRWTVGWRKHLDHPLMLQLEYSHRLVDNGAGLGSDLTENFTTARLDWAF